MAVPISYGDQVFARFFFVEVGGHGQVLRSLLMTASLDGLEDGWFGFWCDGGCFIGFSCLHLLKRSMEGGLFWKILDFIVVVLSASLLDVNLNRSSE